MTSAHPGENERPVVAHVNYLFFASTQSFIYFYLSHLQRVRSICLTRAPESPAIESNLSAAPHYYLYGAPENGSGQGNRRLWSWGLTLRKRLLRLPPRLADAAFGVLNNHIVPRLRSDTDPLRYLEWAASILRRERAKVIHAYHGPMGWRMLTLKRTLGLPLVVTFLGDDLAPTLAPWWWWLIQSGTEKPDWPARLRELFAAADLFLVEGPFMRQHVIDLGCPPEKIEVQRMALPLDSFVPSRPASGERSGMTQPRAGGKQVILFAGRFCEQKGVIYAVQAVARLWAERRDFEFRVIGDETLTDGRYAARVHAAIAAARLQGCVRMLGFLNHADCVREMSRADIFVHPSIVDDNGASEGGAPTAILEAQALAIPVVATRHCDIPNVTIDGETALLVAERDSAALARALGELLDDPERRARMGAAGRRLITERHDIVREAARLEARYLALLGDSDPAAAAR